MKSKLYYLASPYTHTDVEVRNKRFEITSKITVDLLHKNIFTFSPIAYNHPMVGYGLPTDWNFWQEYDTSFLDRCDGLILLMLDGWDISVGVSAEVEYAKQIGLKVYYLDPNNINSFSIEELRRIPPTIIT